MIRIKTNFWFPNSSSQKAKVFRAHEEDLDPALETSRKKSFSIKTVLHNEGLLFDAFMVKVFKKNENEHEKVQREY